MKNSTESKWSRAAKEALILAAVTVGCTFLESLANNSWVSFPLWLVKLVGSIWILKICMSNYGKSHPSESTFRYGFTVCFLSAVVCSVWSAVLYGLIFPNLVEEQMSQILQMIEESGQSMPDTTEDTFGYIQDNFPKLASVSMFIECCITGLIFSGILNRSTSRNRSVFDDDSDEENQD